MRLLVLLESITSRLWRLFPFVILNGIWSVRLSRQIVVAIGFSYWKEKFVRNYFVGKSVIFADSQRSLECLMQILENMDLEFIIWSFENEKMGIDLSFCKGKTVRHMEDGFIRSVGRGLDHTLPWSLCLDKQGAYFDARVSSDLEDMCNNFDRASFSHKQREIALQLMSIVLDLGITKYNAIETIKNPDFKNFDGSGVLVLGQVEDDQSIIRNNNIISTNAELIRRAQSDFPNRTVFFKQHPDCIGERCRPGYVDLSDFSGVYEIPRSISIVQAIEGVKDVYTISSLGGFEALLRGRNVTTFGGGAFYAGWGLTTDHANFPRRRNDLELLELFHITYIEYANYFDPYNGGSLEIKDVVSRLSCIS